MTALLRGIRNKLKADSEGDISLGGQWTKSNVEQRERERDVQRQKNDLWQYKTT